MSGIEEIPLIAAMMEGGAALGEGASTAALSGLGGMGAEQAAMLAAQNAGFGASGLGATLSAASGAQPGLAGAASSGIGGLLSAGSKAAAGPMATQIGMGLLSPQQPQRMAAAPHNMGGGEQAPLPMPYGNPSGNSLNGPPPGMSMEEWLRRKQMMGGMR